MSGKMTSKGITIRRGDSFTIIMRFHAESGDFDISNAAIKMAVRDADDNLLLDKAGIVSDATRGLAAIELTPQDTAIAVGSYKTDIQITFANGQVHTIYPAEVGAVAYFNITEEITR